MIETLFYNLMDFEENHPVLIIVWAIAGCIVNATLVISPIVSDMNFLIVILNSLIGIPGYLLFVFMLSVGVSAKVIRRHNKGKKGEKNVSR